MAATNVLSIERRGTHFHLRGFAHRAAAPLRAAGPFGTMRRPSLQPLGVICMNLHEYQAKAAVRRVRHPGSAGHVAAKTAAEAGRGREALGGNVWVVKAQVHAGGRGKAGGVKLARDRSTRSRSRAKAHARHAARHQPDRPRRPADRPGLRRIGLGDRSRAVPELRRSTASASRIAFIASAAGGMDIEEVARDTPEKILTRQRAPGGGPAALPVPQARASAWVSRAEQIGEFQRSCMRALPSCICEKDASLVEVNPLIVTKDGDLVALDAQDQHRRQRRCSARRSSRRCAIRQEDRDRARARAEHDLNYVSLDGDIACMVNGAGLAMATMDLIKLHGGEPANFLDVGGGATTRARDRGVQADPVEQEGARDPRQHLRRHRALRHDRRGHHHRGEGGRRARCRWSCASKARTPSRAREMLAHSGLAITPATDLTDAAHEGRRGSPQGLRRHEHPGQQEHEGHLPGLHRQAGHVPLRAVPRLRHQARRRRHAGPRRREAPRPAGVRHRARRGRARPAPTRA